jgi:hypothetical protein
MFRCDKRVVVLALVWGSIPHIGCSGGSDRAHDDASVGRDAAGEEGEGEGDSGRGADASDPGPSDEDASTADDGAALDARVGEAGRADAAADRADAAAGRADAAQDAQVQITEDASAVDGGVLGPIRVSGPPFAPPALPVRRLAIGTSSVCVILEDRHVQCIASYEAPGGADVSAAVPDNRDFVMLSKSEEDNGPFIGIRADGSVATWSGIVPDVPLPGAGYIDAFGSNENLCGLKSSGELVCVGNGTVPAYPPGPYLQFAGRTHNVPKNYAGLRADGAIVTNPATADGGVRYSSGEVFTGIALRMEPPYCGIAAGGNVYCSGATGVAGLVRQPFSNVRDVSYGVSHICAVLEDGRATCNEVNGTVSSSAVPKDKRFVDIDTRDYNGTCGTTETGELWCWTKRQGSALQIALSMKAAVK